MGWVGELLSGPVSGVVCGVSGELESKNTKNTVLSSPGLKITKYRLTTSRV